MCDDDLRRPFPSSATTNTTTTTTTTESCVWLVAQSEAKKVTYCDPQHFSQAFFICRETCGACTDSCEDDDDTDGVMIEYQGTLQSCLWLHQQTWELQDEVCRNSTVARMACRESCDVCDTLATVISTDVVIVGAGAAGIRAATRIQEVDDTLIVTVLESADYVGGRASAQRGVGVAGNQYLVENGAQWLTADTTIFNLAQDFNVDFTPFDELDMTLFEYNPCNSTTSSSTAGRRMLRTDRLDSLMSAVETSDRVTMNQKILLKRHLRRLAAHGPQEVRKVVAIRQDCVFLLSIL